MELSKIYHTAATVGGVLLTSDLITLVIIAANGGNTNGAVVLLLLITVAIGILLIGSGFNYIMEEAKKHQKAIDKSKILADQLIRN